MTWVAGGEEAGEEAPSIVQVYIRTPLMRADDWTDARQSTLDDDVAVGIMENAEYHWTQFK